jgi:hypothetical protein
MTRIGALLALALAAAPAAALAADPPAPAPPAAAAPAPPKKLEGVVVEGQRKPFHKCSDRDAPCIAAVVAELKKRYPEQLKVWCFRQKMDEMRNAMNAEAYAGPYDPNGGATAQFNRAPVIRQVCAPDPR